ncbi:MAG: hypothetical protein WED33_04305, partial [Bacteroidia bacterium]
MKNALLLLLFIFAHKLYSQSLIAEWAIGLNNTSNVICTAIDVDNDGNTYVTGSLTSEVDFDPGSAEVLLSPDNSQDFFVAKYSAQGALVWAKMFGGDGSDYPRDIVVDGLGRAHITGFYSPPCDFNPDSPTVVSPAARGGSDVFILSLDTDGNFLRVLGGGGNEFDEG